MANIKIAALLKRLSGKDILKGIDISLEEGVYGLLGANGAGKTTLLRCLTGLYTLDGGRILYDEQPIMKSPAYWHSMGYLPQAFGMFRELTLKEMLEYFCVTKKIERAQIPAAIERCLAAVNLSEKANSRINTLSGGMTRRAGIAQALIGDARVLYFDEPTAGLDPEERARFGNLIANLHRDKIVVISTHIVDDVAMSCDRVIVIDQGTIPFVGSCDELRKKAAGKVYEMPAADPMPDGAFLLRVTHKHGAAYNRVLIEREIQYSALEPTLEDGYICLIKGISR